MRGNMEEQLKNDSGKRHKTIRAKKKQEGLRGT